MNIPIVYKYLVRAELFKFITSDKKIKCHPFGEFTIKEIIDNINDETTFGMMFVFNIYCKHNKI